MKGDSGGPLVARFGTIFVQKKNRLGNVELHQGSPLLRRGPYRDRQLCLQHCGFQLLLGQETLDSHKFIPSKKYFSSERNELTTVSPFHHIYRRWIKQATEDARIF